jgi:hypothetical protein
MTAVGPQIVPVYQERYCKEKVSLKWCLVPIRIVKRKCGSQIVIVCWYGLCIEQVGLKSKLVLERTLKRADSSEIFSEYI